MNYKDTLLMPKTEFEMRGNLPKKEPKYVERWQKENMYERVIEQNKGKEDFVFHDGPPYANGNMHMGHMLNKVIKDVICRYNNMEGRYTPYIPGWDTHGLPIENAIQKLGVNRKEMSTAAFREKCDEYAHEQVNKQMEQLIRMGTFADYKHPYLTLMPEFEANQIDVFAKMAMDGLIFKGLKPVYWSPSSESALAEAEIEYHDIKSPTIFVKFAVKDGKGILDTDTSFVIWTTTPWTIPANLAICLNERYDYALIETTKGKLIVLNELVDSLMEKFEITEYKVIKNFKGSELELITCQHPLYDRESLVILGDHVTAEAGTGCVHTAPGFGADDFFVGQKYGSNVWFERDEKDLLPEGYINEHSPNGIFKKEKDIMDVWFDSGSSHTGCMIERGYRYPVDLYFEGSDQYRGWFNSSLIVGTAAHGCAPYKTVLSHGFVLDGKGNKMSKSLGNTVDPIKLVNQYGADIVRLWATSVAYQQDVRISNDIMKQISENYRKIRNTMRFVLGNLNDFKQADLVAVEALADVDKYMLAQLNDLIKGYHKAYDNYDFAEANQLILNYFTNLLSSFYMDFTKDILYIEKADSLRRRQVQTVLYYHAKAMMKLISPVLVFTAEELHDHFHCDDNKADSIFLEPNVEMINMPNSDQLKAHFDRFLELRKDVMKALEGLRNEKIIKSNMEAKVTISLKDEFKEMASMLADLKQLFIVAKVELVKDSSLEEFDSAYIKVEKFEGHQCPRCWNYFDEDEMEGELCPRCHAVING